MRTWLTLCTFLLNCAFAVAQMPASTVITAESADPASTIAATSTASPAPPLPSVLVKHGLDTVDLVVGSLSFDRWKHGDIRDEATNDSTSITRDLRRTLPPLIEAADLAPAANSKLMPAFQNIDAVYDVLLRVYSAARVAGRPDDVGRLQQALTQLSDARRALADRILSQAEAQERQLTELRASNQALLAVKNIPPPPPEPCKSPVPVHHKKKRTKSTAPAQQKPATSTPTTQKPTH